MSNPVLERKDQPNETGFIGGAAIAPIVDEAYWSYRVALTENQAVVGFPKYSTIGIGMAVEEDWNTNLPYTSDTQSILDHIFHNAGDPAITQEMVREAIELIQEAVREDRP